MFYTKRSINAITCIITIIICICLNAGAYRLNKSINKEQEYLKIEGEVTRTCGTEKVNDDNSWKIEIPSISLKADISEGTSKEIMDKYVGHFEETAKIDGNVGLAAHNRGYNVNYFENIKKLKQNDEIIYNYKGNRRKYKINKIEVIKDTNWSYLENNKYENKITLITCVENQPEYRRCIQGIEEREEKIENKN